MTSPFGLRVRALRKAYGGTNVVSDFSLDVPDGRIAVLRGSNGSGKSTLLGCLAGARSLAEGSVTVYGVDSNPSSARHWRSVYGILDDFPWVPDLTVADHLRLLTQSRDELEVAVSSMGVQPLLNRLPFSLSAGQRQRCALATAMLRRWQVLLLDEPERHLDGDGVITLGRQLAGMLGPGRCAVMATHSRDLMDALPRDLLGPIVDLGAGSGARS